jgi:hypothetical protein
VKVASNSGAAQDAVSGFAPIHSGGKGQRVSLGSSNVAGMVGGAHVANGILGCISGLVSGVKAQAKNVTALATEIEERDRQDAQTLCEAR